MVTATVGQATPVIETLDQQRLDWAMAYRREPGS